MKFIFSGYRSLAAMIGLVVSLTGCVTPKYYDSGAEGDSRRSSSSGRAAGIGVGLGVIGVGTSAILGGRSEGQEQKPQEQTAEEAEKAKNQY